MIDSLGHVSSTLTGIALLTTAAILLIWGVTGLTGAPQVRSFSFFLGCFLLGWSTCLHVFLAWTVLHNGIPVTSWQFVWTIAGTTLAIMAFIYFAREQWSEDGGDE